LLHFESRVAEYTEMIYPVISMPRTNIYHVGVGTKIVLFS
jgi:hypothetical protein